MPNQAELPEVLFERLSERKPDVYRELLASAKYRQYLLVYSGKCSLRFAGHIETLEPGCAVSIPAQIACELEFSQKVDGVWFAILEEFQISRVVTAMPVVLKPNSPFWSMYYSVNIRRDMTGVAQRAARRKIFNDLLSARSLLDYGCEPIVAGYMMLTLFSLTDRKIIHSASSHLQTHRVKAAELVIAFRELIERHYREHWSSGEYCKRLGVTPRRLREACKQVAGLFPEALIHECLMREAQASLLYSNKSISEIAYALGFKSADYFSHFYKRNAGVSPRQELQRLGHPYKK